jgi:hypothetical protein
VDVAPASSFRLLMLSLGLTQTKQQQHRPQKCALHYAGMRVQKQRGWKACAYETSASSTMQDARHSLGGHSRGRNGVQRAGGPQRLACSPKHAPQTTVAQ